MPWYRQLWPWLIIAPPLASVIGGVGLLIIAIAGSDPVVTQDHRRGAAKASRTLTPAEAARCSVRDRACLNTPVEERK
jgi:uncharacterized protein